MSKPSTHEPAIRGEALPADLAAWLKHANEAKRALEVAGFKRTPTVVREAFESMTRHHVTQAPRIPLVLDDLVPGPDYAVPVRIYHPEPRKELPVTIFVHGGGHVAGSVSIYDLIARKLADAAYHLVVSIDYRLAPECPYPAALKDVLAVIKGVAAVLTQRQCRFTPRLSLIGDSAGGALCATAAQRLQYEPHIRLHRLVLIYPSLDYTLSMPSIETYAAGYLLEYDRIAWYFDQYFRGAEHRRECSPLFMELTQAMPATLVLSAPCCPLVDEGLAFVERLRAVGVRAEHVSCDGMIHAFLNLEDLVPVQCAAAYRQIGAFLRD
jgi:acetyl esterase/lipase